MIALSHSVLVLHQEICHPCLLHQQNQSQKKPMKLIYVENLDRSIFFPTFDSDDAISREANMNETTSLQLSAVICNWTTHRVKFSFAEMFVFGVKFVFAAINTAKFFLLNKTFLQFFKFTKCTIVFWNLSLSGLTTLLQTSISWLSIKTSTSVKTDITDSSKTSSEIDSGIPLKTSLFR